MGGPRSNSFTRNELGRFVPGFRLLLDAENFKTSDWERESQALSQPGFVVGERELLVKDSEEYGLIIKLTPELTDQDKVIFLIFGYTGHGTAGAAYFLWRYHRQLSAAFGRKSFCVGIKVYQSESYKRISRTFLDLTAAAFNA